MPAFDQNRPPDHALIDACVHCGFCLATCPTYVLWGEEMDSPRGRIVLMDQGLEPGSTMTASMAEHFDRCLGCMACVTACPSGVRYDRLIESTRPQVERHAARTPAERLLRRLMFAVFTHPERLRVLAPALRLANRVGLTRAARESSLLSRSPRLAALARVVPDRRAARRLPRLPPMVPARGTSRGTVGILRGCVQRVFFHDVNLATARVLSAEGFEVRAPEEPRCCGALQLHGGQEREAAALAKDTIRAFEGCDLVAVNAAGCGSAMKEYGHLLSDEPGWAGRARRFSDRVRDVSEVLAGVEPVAPRGPVELKVAYHDACHLAHAQGVRWEPRALLGAIPGLELVEPAEWEICCGSAGVYNLLQPEAGAELGRRKAGNLLATGAQAIAAGNPGCALQISSFLSEAGRPLPVHHPIELVDRSIRAGRRALLR